MFFSDGEALQTSVAEGFLDENARQRLLQKRLVVVDGAVPLEAVAKARNCCFFFGHESGQTIATSHDRFPPNGGLVGEIPLFQGNLGW